jgi:RAB protein geranylgeranyltransferase component A
VDLIPKFLMANGQLVKLLVHTGKHFPTIDVLYSTLYLFTAYIYYGQRWTEKSTEVWIFNINRPKKFMSNLTAYNVKVLFHSMYHVQYI